MFDWVDVTVLDVTRVIRFVSDEVLPKTALPNSPFTAGLPHGAQPFALWNRFGEPRLDLAPSQGEIGVVGWQSPHGVYVVGQNDERVDVEGKALPELAASIE